MAPRPGARHTEVNPITGERVALHPYNARDVARILRSLGTRPGLAELAAVHGLRDVLDEVEDTMARKLLADGLSYREVGAALDLDRSTVARRYPGASSRDAGGQPAAGR